MKIEIKLSLKNTINVSLRSNKFKNSSTNCIACSIPRNMITNNDSRMHGGKNKQKAIKLLHNFESKFLIMTMPIPSSSFSPFYFHFLFLYLHLKCILTQVPGDYIFKELMLKFSTQKSFFKMANIIHSGRNKMSNIYQNFYCPSTSHPLGQYRDIKHKIKIGLPISH